MRTFKAYRRSDACDKRRQLVLPVQRRHVHLRRWEQVLFVDLRGRALGEEMVANCASMRDFCRRPVDSGGDSIPPLARTRCAPREPGRRTTPYSCYQTETGICECLPVTGGITRQRPIRPPFDRRSDGSRTGLIGWRCAVESLVPKDPPKNWLEILERPQLPPRRRDQRAVPAFGRAFAVYALDGRGLRRSLRLLALSPRRNCRGGVKPHPGRMVRTGC